MIACLRGIAAVLFLSQSALALDAGIISFELANPYGAYTHTADIRVIHFSASEWKEYEIQAQLEEAANVYAQCGVKLNVSQIYSSNLLEGVVMFDLEGYTDASEIPEKNGALNLAKEYASPQELNIFFMQSFDPDFGTVSATAVPESRVVHKDQLAAQNTIWIAHKIERQRHLSYAEGGFHSGYSVLAHEVGHVLLNAGHIEDRTINNLMHAWGQNRNGRLTLAQCKTIQNSPLVRPVQNFFQRVNSLRGLKSPIMGGVYFAPGAETNFFELNNIVEKMEQVQDEVSDLQPVKHIDFYLEPPKNQLIYLDRHAFAGSLTPTYDAVGRILLNAWQSEKLWLHELGHAILNSQLAVDWPWYAARDKLMVRWGRQVYQATIQDNNHAVTGMARSIARSRIRMIESAENHSEYDSSKILSEINALPNLARFEEILAPYHEFFSDALVMIYTQDPLVMSRALQHPDCFELPNCVGEESEEVTDRDYSFLRDLETWSSDEVHGMFTPALAYIWRAMNESSAAGRSKQEVLRIVYRALSEEVLARTADPSLWKMSPPEANRRLIKLCQALFR